VKKLINNLVCLFGYEFRRIRAAPIPAKPAAPPPSKVALEFPLGLADALRRATQRGLKIGTVIDVGASNGQWSRKCMPFFPDAFYFLLEANPVHQADLEKFQAAHSQSKYVLAAAGDQEGEIHFRADALFGGTGVSSI
jgi:hypothetical protein